MASTSVQVAVRIRPLIASEIDRGCHKVINTIPNEPQIIIKGNDKAFTFNHVFDSDTSQQEFYETSVKNLTSKLFDGYNVTILAYGQTGSGKTHSMGTSGSADAGDIGVGASGSGDMGVIPRAVNDIFNVISNTNDTEYKITVSFMELYQECLYDLLAGNAREKCVVDIREKGKNIVIPGLTEQPVFSAQETMNYLIKGSKGRATGATAMNTQSSRSHAIFTITIQQNKIRNSTNVADTITSKFHIVDLAGSERSKKTQTTGERFKEGVNINKSLLVLGNVISALCDNSNFICYRDSKLTRLLKDSLGGNSFTLMVACVSPADYNVDETINTLRYADRAQRIKNKPIVNQDPKTAEILRLNKKVNELQLELIGLKGVGKITPSEIIQLREEKEECRMKNYQLSEKLKIMISDNIALYEKFSIVERANSDLKKQLSELEMLFLKGMDELFLSEDDAREFDPAKKKIDEIKHFLKSVENSIGDLDMDACKSSLKEQFYLPFVQNMATNDANMFYERQIDYDEKQAELSRKIRSYSTNIANKKMLIGKLVENGEFLKLYSQNLDILRKSISLRKEERRINEICLSDSKVGGALYKESYEETRKLKNDVVEKLELIENQFKYDDDVQEYYEEIMYMKNEKDKCIKEMRERAKEFYLWCKENLWHDNKYKEEIRAIQNCRIKESMVVEEKQNFEKTDKNDVQHWLHQEIDAVTKIIETVNVSEQLDEQRKTLLEKNSILPANSNEINNLKEELELRSVQITDLQQKVANYHQGDCERSKLICDKIQTMTDAKSAIEVLFKKMVETMQLKSKYKSELDELKVKYTRADVEYKQVLTTRDLMYAELQAEYQSEMYNIQMYYENKISLLLNPEEENMGETSCLGDDVPEKCENDCSSVKSPILKL